jgi:hypothetical protein
MAIYAPNLPLSEEGEEFAELLNGYRTAAKPAENA